MAKADVEEALTGKTLKVYFYLYSIRKPVSAREVQKEMRLSSPSVASYHLEKLCKLGLVNKNDSGQYVLLEEVKAGILHLFINFRRHLFPRYFLYASYFAGLVIFYFTLFTAEKFDIKDIYILILGLSGIAISVYEVIAIRRMQRL